MLIWALRMRDGDVCTRACPAGRDPTIDTRDIRLYARMNFPFDVTGLAVTCEMRRGALLGVYAVTRRVNMLLAAYMCYERVSY